MRCASGASADLYGHARAPLHNPFLIRTPPGVKGGRAPFSGLLGSDCRSDTPAGIIPSDSAFPCGIPG